MLRKKIVKFNRILAFQILKKALSNDKIFDPKKEEMPTKDASEHGVELIISKEGHLAIYLSRNLTVAETNNSDIEKETLSIV